MRTVFFRSLIVLAVLVIPQQATGQVKRPSVGLRGDDQGRGKNPGARPSSRRSNLRRQRRQNKTYPAKRGLLGPRSERPER
jgi:hypothetical protein